MQRDCRCIHDGDVEPVTERFGQDLGVLNDDQREKNGKYPHILSMKNLVQTCTGNRRTDGVGGGVQNQDDRNRFVDVPFQGGNDPTVPGIMLTECRKLTWRQT